MNKAYSRIVWENYPSLKTAINETNLNKIDSAVDIHDDRIIEMDTTKANQVDLLTALKEISVNEKTGVITMTKFDGSTVDINTNMSKVAVNFRFDSTTQQLIITLEDGTETPVDLSAFITDYEFVDSDTVGFSVGDDGKVKAIIKEGSIAEKYLDPNYLAEVRVQASNAEKSATDASQSVVDAQEQVDIAKSWAVGGTGKREGEDDNNAKVFAERAEKAAQDASDIAGGKFVPLSDKGIPNGVATLDESGKVPSAQLPSMGYISTNEKGIANGVPTLDSNGQIPKEQIPIMDVGIATTEKAGVVKPDGVTIDVNSDGVINSLHALESFISENGVHGLRYYKNTLSYKSGNNWVDIFTATITVSVESGSTVYLSDGQSKQSVSGVAAFKVGAIGTYTVYATKNNGKTATNTVNVTSELEYKTSLSFATLTVKSPSGCTIAVSKDSYSYSRVSTGSDLFYLPITGYWKVTIAQSDSTASDTVAVSSYANYTKELSFVHIYGVKWDGTSTTKWSRTDESANFIDPVPYVAGASSYSSPFDNLLPWSGMKVSTRTGGEMVSIPKFWYKLEQSGNSISIKIADRAVSGYYVSPAHMNRGDGKGERDVIYVGRFHCVSGYKSTKGSNPLANITRATARSGCHGIGANYWQIDFATRLTIQLLYLVEFADWNSQTKIGYGCGNNSGAQAVGSASNMPYHTGTMQSARTTYGVGVQYRYIEGLWDNVYDWMDGCYYNSSGLNIVLKPANFSDSSNGTVIGVPSNGYPSAFKVDSKAGFPLFYPTTASGNGNTYSADYWYFYASNPCLYSGGNYSQNLNRGLFFVNFSSVSSTYAYVGCRLLELP